MCNKEGRDERGRFAPGASGNVKGRPPRGAMARFAKLLAAVEAAGARITITLPGATANEDTPPVPPVTR